MANRSEPLFLARDSYRRRRLGDAARLMTLLGFVLLLLPVLLTSTTQALLYIFTVWALLIVIMVILSRRLSGAEAAERGEDPPKGPGGS